MSKMTIIEGNSNDKDNTRVFMVKGEKGVSPTVSATKEGKIATVTVTDFEGTDTVEIDDGFSPTVQTTKVGDTATITITDAEGEHTFTIEDGSTAPPHREILFDNSNNTATQINLSDSIFNYRYLTIYIGGAYVQVPIYQTGENAFFRNNDIYSIGIESGGVSFIRICVLDVTAINNGQTIQVYPHVYKIRSASPYFEDITSTTTMNIRRVCGVR